VPLDELSERERIAWLVQRLAFQMGERGLHGSSSLLQRASTLLTEDHGAAVPDSEPRTLERLGRDLSHLIGQPEQ
jgi:hypothetical protein